MFNETVSHSVVKRQFMKWNVGGHETNPSITGSNNHVLLAPIPDIKEQETLLRKAGDQVGKLLEGGTSVALAPAKWLNHMQDNWLTYLVCITILVVSLLIIYCIVRRKISAVESYGHQNLSKIMLDDMMKITSFRRALQDDIRNV